jgi:hypothetical protein
MRSIHSKSLAFLGAYTLCLQLHAQSTKIPPKPLAGYLHGPFMQRNETSLGPGFLGHDVKEVVSNIDKASMRSKSEFETTEQFESRIAAIAPPKQYIFVNDPATDAHPIDKYSDAGAFVYNADVQSFSRTITMFYVQGVFALRSITTPTGQYVGTNSFGVRVVVNRFDRTVYELQIDEPSSFFEKGGDYDTSYFIHLVAPVPREAAMSVKSHLRIAILCTLTKMEIQHEDPVSSATVDKPTEVHWHEKIIPVGINKVIVFDDRAGNILSVLEDRQGHW